jgi:fumarylacetoacetase
MAQQNEPLASWLDIDPASDFSLANLPFGIISTSASPNPHVGVAVGSYVLDMKELACHPKFYRVFDFIAEHGDVFSKPTLNAFAALGRPIHKQTRSRLQDVLSAGNSTYESFLRKDDYWISRIVVPAKSVKLHLPVEIGDYTDFYAGYHHAFHVGCMFRGPDNALQPNYTHLPVGYHGRASSVVVSGTTVRRPRGQILPQPPVEGQPKQPITAPCRRLDFELEFGCIIATPNALGDGVSVGDAEDHIFGYVLLNDWSARDIQTWEYVPLGPFNSKNFATSISSWVVLADALEPFRTEALENKTEVQEYLKGGDKAVFDINLEVELKSKSIRLHPPTLQPPSPQPKPTCMKVRNRFTFFILS